MAQPFIGVYLNPYFVQAEGLATVFDRLEKMSATAVVTRPSVARVVEPPNGVRFPDLHVDGYRRVLARPLWGKREQHLDVRPSFRPNSALFEKTRYKPREVDWTAGMDPETPARIVAEAQRRGMEAHFQLSPFFPGDPHEDDVPMFVDGTRKLTKRFSKNACLNSPDAFDYAVAVVADVLDNYPALDGIMPDWVEFGAYRLEDNFTCFCPHCEAEARAAGFGWDAMRTDVLQVWNWFHDLSEEKLRTADPSTFDPEALPGLIERHAGLSEFRRFKSHSVAKYYSALNTMFRSRGREDLILTARGWPPPWNMSSGMDYGALSQFCQVAAPKLFLFDYSALPRWYGEKIKEWNPHLSEQAILDFLVGAMNLPDDIEPRTFARYNIPAPDERHTAAISCYRGRTQDVIDAARPQTRVRPFAHAYLPLDQWREKLTMLRELGTDGIWIQMYGYLSDDRMKAVKDIWS